MCCGHRPYVPRIVVNVLIAVWIACGGNCLVADQCLLAIQGARRNGGWVVENVMVVAHHVLQSTHTEVPLPAPGAVHRDGFTKLDVGVALVHFSEHGGEVSTKTVARDVEL